MGIQVVTVHRYLGGFIGDREAEERWLGYKITGWADSVESLVGVYRKHRSLHMQDCRIHSSRSGNSCSRLLQASAMN